MTDKPTPTDAELKALLLDKLPASKHYIRPVIEKMVAAMQAAIDKWGQPAQATEPVAWAFKYDDGTWHDPSTTEHSSGMRPLFAAPQPVVREPLTCEWTHNDDDGYWDTSCGKAWRFDDGGPKENNMNFCHCCGKTLRIKGGQHGSE